MKSTKMKLTFRPEDVPALAAALNDEFEWPEVGLYDWMQVVAFVAERLGAKL